MTRVMLIAAICAVLVFHAFLPLYAQEAADTPAASTQETKAAEEAAPKASTETQKTGAAQGDQISSLINKIIGYVAQIGNLFGQATGVRIGGTTGSAIAALALAKFLEDKAPSWIKYLLYAGGGTMLAGGGANIAQLVKQVLPGIIP